MNYSGTLQLGDEDLDADRHRHAHEPDRSGRRRSRERSRARCSSPVTPGLDPAWGYLFADTTSCTTLGNNLTIDAPIYVRGDLCMENSALITADLVQVRGKVQIKNSASIGTAPVPVTQVKVGGGCRYPWSGSYVSPCTSAHKVYRTVFSSTVPDLTKPAIDLPTWYANAKPGPMSPTCTTGSFPGQFDNDTALNRSNPIQNLFPDLGLRLPGQGRQWDRPRAHRLHARHPRNISHRRGRVLRRKDRVRGE